MFASNDLSAPRMAVRGYFANPDYQGEFERFAALSPSEQIAEGEIIAQKILDRKDLTNNEKVICVGVRRYSIDAVSRVFGFTDAVKGICQHLTYEPEFERVSRAAPQVVRSSGSSTASYKPPIGLRHPQNEHSRFSAKDVLWTQRSGLARFGIYAPAVLGGASVLTGLFGIQVLQSSIAYSAGNFLAKALPAFLMSQTVVPPAAMAFYILGGALITATLLAMAVLLIKNCIKPQVQSKPAYSVN